MRICGRTQAFLKKKRLWYMISSLRSRRRREWVRGIEKQNQRFSPNPDVGEKQKAKSFPEGKSSCRLRWDQASLTDLRLLSSPVFLFTVLKCAYEATCFPHTSRWASRVRARAEKGLGNPDSGQKRTGWYPFLLGWTSGNPMTRTC